MEQLIAFVVLLVLGLVFGQINERRHFRSIRQREAEFADILTFSERFPPPSERGKQVALVGGNVVVSVDYFKLVAASLRSLIGGRISVYETLLERGRREAILRMKAEARQQGANFIWNVKLTTASLSQGRKNQIGCIEVYAYGTALSSNVNNNDSP